VSRSPQFIPVFSSSREPRTCSRCGRIILPGPLPKNLFVPGEWEESAAWAEFSLLDTLFCTPCVRAVRAGHSVYTGGYHVGDVLVHVGDPPGDNPYAGHTLLGEARAQALAAWRRDYADPSKLESSRGNEAREFTFWFAPYNGGAFRLHGPSVVRWGE